MATATLDNRAAARELAEQRDRLVTLISKRDAERRRIETLSREAPHSDDVDIVALLADDLIAHPKAELADARRTLGLLNSAIAAQTRHVDDARRAAEREAARDRLPEYRKLMKTIIAALADLEPALDELAELSRNVSSGAMIRPNILAKLCRRANDVEYFLNDARESLAGTERNLRA